MKTSMTDKQLGYSDGFCGLIERYPNNVNYMAGFKLGHKYLMSDEPLESMLPGGTNDALSDEVSI